ncbi:hypothetical protein KSD_52090 [Ktedonobacter sp. SOSP1-85]|uniref:L,D-transpeptidase n=1 Tax=Ktedonobacter sp. SOSP1-85 TaxID=2778367 RepID=UPI001915A7E0|nr:L,D-transpeptidase [Ktedonobacter sp. SOSP1-85]GHO77438.1 hypothetical protein KSD_52090 [Ktedonobacter sp. SOSP1-85]
MSDYNHYQPDQTESEQDPRNEAVILALHESVAWRERQTQELSDAEIERSIASVRSRFQARLAQREQPHLRLVPNSSRALSDYTPQPRRRIKLTRYIAIAAVIVLLIGSSLAISNMFQTGRSSISSTQQTTATPWPTPTLTAAPIQSPREQAQALVQQLDKETRMWGQAHPYLNPTDGKTYQLDYSYQALVTRLQALEKIAKSDADYTYIATLTQQELELHHAFEQTAQSKPSLNQPTASELHLLSSLKLNNKTVIVVSLAMQSARVYTNGSLARSFHIASSFTRLPTMPGHFQVDYTFEQGTLASDALPPGQGHIEVSYELFYKTIKQAEHPGAYYRSFIYCNPQRSVFGPNAQLPHIEGAHTADGSITSGIEAPGRTHNGSITLCKKGAISSSIRVCFCDCSHLLDQTKNYRERPLWRQRGRCFVYRTVVCALYTRCRRRLDATSTSLLTGGYPVLVSWRKRGYKFPYRRTSYFVCAG